MFSDMNHVLNNISHIMIPFLGKQAIYSTLLVLLIFPITLVLRKRALSWQIGLWLLVMVRVVLPPSVSGPWSARQLIEYTYHRVFQGESVESELPFDMETLPESPPTRTAAFTLNASPSGWENGLFVLWAAGVLATSFRFIRQHAHYRVLLRHADTVRDVALHELLHRYRTQFRIRRRIRLVTGDIGLSPFTAGILHPTIFLPSHLLQQDDDITLRAVLAHEVVHVAQYDNLWLLLQSIVRTVYFFHPVVWLTTRRLTVLRECRCDHVVVTQCRISIRTYQESLLTAIEHLVTPTHTPLLSTFCSANPYRVLTLRLGRLSALQHHITGENLMSRSQKLGMTCVLFVFGVFILPMAPGIGQEVAHHDFVAPIHDGHISSPFGPRIHPITKQEIFHQGIDIAVAVGTEIYAIADGTVLSVPEEDNDYGKNLIIQHADGFTSRYAKLSDILVTEGQTVKVGEKIALSGNTGVSTGPHLHFELQQDGQHVNPAIWIDFSAFGTASAR